MERQFSFEAKSFRFSTKVGSSMIRLEERRKKFFGYILVSPQCSAWLIDTVEAACLAKENIAKYFREGDKALMVHGGDNKAGRFLEVAVFAEGGRKGGLWLPEGRNGRGWQRFAEELRILLAPPDGGPVEAEFRSAPSPKSSPAKLAEAGGSGVCSMARTFAEIVKSKPRSFSEKETGGIDYEGEAAGSVKSLRGIDVKGWVERLLGFVQCELGRVVTGLLEGLLIGPDDLPIRKRIKAVLKSLKVGDGPALEFISTGHASGSYRVKLGRKRNGLGRLCKPKKAAEPGPFKLASGVHLLSSAQRSHAEEPKPASEGRLGTSGAEISEPEREVGKSPPPSMLPACEVCVGATTLKSNGSGAEVVTSSSSPASEGDPVPSSVFGLPVDDIVQIASTTLVASASPAITPLTPVPAVSVAGLEPLGFEDPGDSSVQGIGSVPVPVELAGEEKTLALVSPPVEQDPGMAVDHSLPAKVSDDTNFDTFSGLSVQDKVYMDTSSASAPQLESPILAGIQCDSSEVIPDDSSDSSAGTYFGLTKSQSWLLASLREAVQDDAVHLALVNDMEESWRQTRKDVHEVLSSEEEDRNLAFLKAELEWFIGGRKGPQTYLRASESTEGL
jgi:hypothetical protein